MRWMKFTLTTTTAAEDLISGMLMDLGVEGIEIEDRVPLTDADKKQMFVDILPDIEDDDGTAQISFYLENACRREELIKEVQAGLEELKQFVDVGAAVIAESQTEDKDWINNWKQYFKQFYVDDILIKPSWEEVKDEDREKMLIQIDPGTAFGTGMHETTQLCIRQLKKFVSKESVLLDVGCGSGILSIIALKLGAAFALGTDLDPNAVSASMENMEVNHIVPGSFEVIAGNIIGDTAVQELAGFERFDIVIANILAEVLVPLTPVILNQLKSGGFYITSGIIAEKECTVVDAVLRSGLELIEVTRQGEWVCVTARKSF